MRRVIALLTILMCAAVGCGDSHEHGAAPPGDHDHSADGEAKTAQITVWTNGYEVFAEHTAPIFGREMRLITHVTELQTGEPRSAGPIQFLFRQGDSSFDHSQAAPENPGLYLPVIKFPKEGEWQASVMIPGETNAMIDLGVLRIFANEEGAAGAEYPEGPEGISFLKEQQWKITLKTEAMTRRTLVERVAVLAQVRAKPGKSAEISAPFPGQIRARTDDKFPIPGDRVEAGDLLALIRPRFSEAAIRFFETQSELDAATAALKQAEVAYERVKALVEVEARPRRDLEEAELALATARARHSAAVALRSNEPGNDQNNAAPGTFELRAPIAGVITSVNAGIGEPVTSDQSVFTVLDPSVVWIEASVPESGLARFGSGKNALCQLLDGSDRQFSIASKGGKLVFTGLKVDPQTRAVPLIYELDNTSIALRIGQAVRLQVETAAAREVPSIPHSALVEEGGLFVVFVHASGETFVRRQVRLGIRDGSWIEVISGLSPDERVVTEGAYAVRLASAANVVPSHGHTH